MSDTAVVFLLIPGLFISVLLFVGVGRRMDIRRVIEETDRERVVLTTIETAIYALLGLMVAFTFGGAASRFDARRTLTVSEANAIGDAYQRLDLLPEQAQPALRELFRRYGDERLQVFISLPDARASERHAARANLLQLQIWNASVAAAKASPRPETANLLLVSLNEMSGIATTRSVMLRAHTPPVVIGVLVVLTLICAVLIGNGFPSTRKAAPPIHVYGFALVMSITLYVTFDLDHPRVGLIRLDYADQAMTDLIGHMGPTPGGAAQAP
jgi:hypothetical protein